MGSLEFLISPDALKILGPAGLFFICTCFALVKVFRLYVTTQEKRIEDAKTMLTEYKDLAASVDRTLSTLLAVIGKRRDDKRD